MTGPLSDFLKAKRAAISPEDAGMTSYGRRRVPGLRREELAQLAGVSASYYTRIEQGQTEAASPAVLEALARALRLDPQEKDHLLRLAQPPGRRVKRYRDEQPAPALVGLMTTMDSVAAALVGRSMDVLAWNPLGHALLAPHVAFEIPSDPQLRPNWARLLFTDPHTRALFLDWEEKCWDVASYLRLQAGSHPHDARLGNLVGELCLSSRTFDDMWASQSVRDKGTNRCRMHHAVAGGLDLVNVPLRAPEASDQLLGTFYAPAGSSSAHGLSLLLDHATERTNQEVAPASDETREAATARG